MYLTRKKINQLSQSKFLEIKNQMKKLKSLVKTTTESSEKILNGLMELELLLLLMLSISDYLDTIYITVKLMPILSFSELLESITLNLLLEEPQIVSPLPMMKTITGLYVPSMEPQLLIGFAQFLKLLDYHALKKEKPKPQKKLFKLLNLY
jgi:hypothetical protein